MVFRSSRRISLYLLIIVLLACLIYYISIPTSLKIVFRHIKRKVSDLSRSEDASQNLLEAGFDDTNKKNDLYPKYKDSNIYPIPQSKSSRRKNITKEIKEEQDSPYNFNQINLDRLKLLKKTCQEMGEDDRYRHRAANLTEYKTNKPFINKFSLRQSDFDKPRFTEAWKYTKDKGAKRAKWIMCLNPKHGTSNWQRSIIASMRNKSSDQIVWNSYLYKVIPNLGEKRWLSEIVNTIVSAKKKVLLARHPINKLYSAWADKFRTNNEHYHIYEKWAAQMPVKYMDRTPANHAVSFPDFIRYWLDNKKELWFDVHWKSQEYDCFPCSVDWDFIATTETSDHDNNAIMNILYPDSAASILPKYDHKAAKSKNAYKIEDNNKWLPENYKEELREHFKWELKMFGYEY